MSKAGGVLLLIIGVSILGGSIALYDEVDNELSTYEGTGGEIYRTLDPQAEEEYQQLQDLRIVAIGGGIFGAIIILGGLESLSNSSDGVGLGTSTTEQDDVDTKALRKDAQETRIEAQNIEERGAEAYDQDNWSRAIRRYGEARREYNTAKGLFSDLENIERRNDNYSNSREYKNIRRFCDYMSDACLKMEESARARKNGEEEEAEKLKEEAEEDIEQAKQHY
jgi:hypothetical protein